MPSPLSIGGGHERAHPGAVGFGFMVDTPLAVAPGAVIVNPDGVSIKGATCIYAPPGQAGEYAALACNPYRGCGHTCLYCWVPDITHQPRAEFQCRSHR
jgi:hypothetical protein